MFRRLILISSIVVALAGTAALAQGVRGNSSLRGGAGGQFRQRAGGRAERADRMLERLQQKLNLNETQVSGLRALQETRRKEMESLRQETQPKRQALRQLLQQPNPNPNDVGNATLALRNTRQRTKEIKQRFLSGLKGLLTPEQLQILPKRFNR
jgi:Spy/CpxP family protein refolding chaperone